MSGATNGTPRLSHFLRQVMNWTWDEFVLAERDAQHSTSNSLVFAVVRSCAMQNLHAIRIALNRLDGKLKTPVQLELPKVYFLYPHAQLPEGESSVAPELTTGASAAVVSSPPPPPAVEGEVLPSPGKPEPESEPGPVDVAELSLRQVLSEMAELPRSVPKAIIKRALEVEQKLRAKEPLPDDIPRVKSVVAAHLLQLGQRRNMDALYEIFDNIEGKLAETIQVLGSDIYITSYASTAPPGAVPNADGILQLEATDAQAVWAEKLKRGTR